MTLVALMIDSIHWRMPEMIGALPGFVFAVGPHDRGTELPGGGFELGVGIAHVSDDRLITARAAREQADGDLASAAFRQRQDGSDRCSVRAETSMSAVPLAGPTFCVCRRGARAELKADRPGLRNAREPVVMIEP
jgi:hypothetical protein